MFRELEEAQSRFNNPIDVNPSSSSSRMSNDAAPQARGKLTLGRGYMAEQAELAEAGARDDGREKQQRLMESLPATEHASSTLGTGQSFGCSCFPARIRSGHLTKEDDELSKDWIFYFVFFFWEAQAFRSLHQNGPIRVRPINRLNELGTLLAPCVCLLGEKFHD